MARVSRFLLLLCVSALILKSDARWFSRSSSSSTSHSSPSHSSSSSHGSSHSYPSSHSSSGSLSSHGYPSVSSSKHSYPPSSGSSSSGYIKPSISYPSSSGISGSGKSTYPSSGGLSGSGSASSYPSSGGLSGSGSNGYPKSPTSIGNSVSGSNYPASGGLSGTGSGGYPKYPFNINSGSGSSYPSSGGLSGTGSGGYPKYPTSNVNSGSGVSYPSSSGLSGTGSQPKYPVSSGNSDSHAYPSSSGLSGGGSNSNYPTGVSGGTNYPTNKFPNMQSYPPGGGLSGTNTHGSMHHIHHTTNTNTVPNRVVHHHHYYYNPPKSVYYSAGNGLSINYPVYRGELPRYVYEYRSSGSMFSNLLAGLALYNLGQTSANHRVLDYHSKYKSQPNEICIFGVRYPRGNYDEMRIDCNMITTFIWTYEKMTPRTNIGTNTVITNTTTVTTNVVSNQMVLPNGALASAAQPIPQVQFNPNNNYAISPNDTLVNRDMIPNQPFTLLPNGSLASNMPPGSQIQQLVPVLGNGMLPNGTLVSGSPITTTTTTSVVSATDTRYIGEPIKLTQDMDCYVKRITPDSNFEKKVPCDLLDNYSKQSLIIKNSAVKVKPAFTFTAIAIAVCTLSKSLFV